MTWGSLTFPLRPRNLSSMYWFMMALSGWPPLVWWHSSSTSSVNWSSVTLSLSTASTRHWPVITTTRLLQTQTHTHTIHTHTRTHRVTHTHTQSHTHTHIHSTSMRLNLVLLKMGKVWIDELKHFSFLSHAQICTYSFTHVHTHACTHARTCKCL